MLKLPALSRGPLAKAARGMSGAPQKLECFIDGKKVEFAISIHEIFQVS